MPRSKPDPRLQSRPIQYEAVDPIWLLKAISLTLLAALICGYLAFCLLFYQGQWQLVLHPTRTSVQPETIAGIPYKVVRFAPDESAVPQLTGWWIPAASAAPYSQATVLFLPGADGSLLQFLSTLTALHNVGINIFAFDYRGYGQSAAIHPNQQKMMHDADSAWQYLIDSQAVHAQRIVPYGIDVGASLATHLALTHDAIPALILDSPHADLLDTVRHDPRSRLIPMDLLFHDRFPLNQPLSTLRTPKLLLSRSMSSEKAFEKAADPKVIAKLPSSSFQAAYRSTLTEFLSRYLLPDLRSSP